MSVGCVIPGTRLRPPPPFVSHHRAELLRQLAEHGSQRPHRPLPAAGGWRRAEGREPGGPAAQRPNAPAPARRCPPVAAVVM